MSLAERLGRLLTEGTAGAAWVYDQHAARLFNRLSRRYGYLGEEEVEDLLQDTFVLALRDEGRLLRNWAAGAGAQGVDEPALERYLWDLACGLASNRRRSAAARRVVAFPSGEEPVSAPLAETGTLDRDFLRRLLACLKSSGSRVFLYFTLRYRDGLSPEDVAAATGWSKKATYKQRQALNEALERCRAQLAG